MYGINLRCDGDTGDYLSWMRRASALEEQPTMAGLLYPPHITLAKFETIEIGMLERGVDALRGLRPIDIRFTSIGMFEKESLILWLTPEISSELRRAHRLIHNVVEPSSCRTAYLPDQWVPHCTLALAVPIERRLEAELLMREFERPFTLTFATADCVLSPPIRVLKEHHLTPSENV